VLTFNQITPKNQIEHFLYLAIRQKLVPYKA